MANTDGLCSVLTKIFDLPRNMTDVLKCLIELAEYHEGATEKQSYCYFEYKRGDPNRIAEKIADKIKESGQKERNPAGLRLPNLIKILEDRKVLVRVAKSNIYKFNTAIFGHHDWRKDDNFTLTISISNEDVSIVHDEMEAAKESMM